MNIQICIVFFMTILLISHGFILHNNKQPAPAYNISLSKEIVRWAAVAFCKNGCVNTWSCKTGQPVPLVQTLYNEYKITKAAGFVGYSSKHNAIVLSFRGSNNIQNWIQDFNFEKFDYPRCLGCEVHYGFYADYVLMEKVFTTRVTALLQKYKNASIITTGHSLGAAIAAITAIEMKSLFPNTKVNLHNFGQPRVGNIKMAEFMNSKLDGIYRVVHNRDLVPHLAPDIFPFNYHHSPYQIFFNDDFTSYKICDNTGQDKSCSNKFFPDYNPNDHDHYFLKISQTQC